MATKAQVLAALDGIISEGSQKAYIAGIANSGLEQATLTRRAHNLGEIVEKLERWKKQLETMPNDHPDFDALLAKINTLKKNANGVFLDNTILAGKLKESFDEVLGWEPTQKLTSKNDALRTLKETIEASKDYNYNIRAITQPSLKASVQSDYTRYMDALSEMATKLTNMGEGAINYQAFQDELADLQSTAYYHLMGNADQGDVLALRSSGQMTASRSSFEARLQATSAIANVTLQPRATAAPTVVVSQPSTAYIKVSNPNNNNNAKLRSASASASASASSASSASSLSPRESVRSRSNSFTSEAGSSSGTKEDAYAQDKRKPAEKIITSNAIKMTKYLASIITDPKNENEVGVFRVSGNADVIAGQVTGYATASLINLTDAKLTNQSGVHDVAGTLKKLFRIPAPPSTGGPIVGLPKIDGKQHVKGPDGHSIKDAKDRKITVADVLLSVMKSAETAQKVIFADPSTMKSVATTDAAMSKYVNESSEHRDALKRLLEALPASHIVMLKTMIEMYKAVASNSDKNQMTAYNLGTVVGDMLGTVTNIIPVTNEESVRVNALYGLWIKDPQTSGMLDAALEVKHAAGDYSDNEFNSIEELELTPKKLEAKRAAEANGMKFVDKIMDALQAGVNNVGIFRTAGDDADAAKLMKKGELPADFKNTDLATAMLKKILKDPSLIGLSSVPYSEDRSTQAIAALEEGKKESLDFITNHLKTLPVSHMQLLKRMIEVLHAAELNSEENKMDRGNLAATTLDMFEFMGLQESGMLLPPFLTLSSTMLQNHQAIIRTLEDGIAEKQSVAAPDSPQSSTSSAGSKFASLGRAAGKAATLFKKVESTPSQVNPDAAKVVSGPAGLTAYVQPARLLKATTTRNPPPPVPSSASSTTVPAGSMKFFSSGGHSGSSASRPRSNSASTTATPDTPELLEAASAYLKDTLDTLEKQSSTMPFLLARLLKVPAADVPKRAEALSKQIRTSLDDVNKNKVLSESTKTLIETLKNVNNSGQAYDNYMEHSKKSVELK